MTRAEIEPILDRYFERYRVVEESNKITFQLAHDRKRWARAVFFKNVIESIRAAGIEFSYENLPWYRCIFNKKQWIVKY